MQRSRSAINKSYLTNSLLFVLLCLSFVVKSLGNENAALLDVAHYLYFGSLFGLSGSLTNLLAIHMLFEKIPFLYGSGVIEKRFSEFKDSIRSLMMEQFFSMDRIKAFFEQEMQDLPSGIRIDKESIAQLMDKDKLFDGIVTGIEKSPLAGFLPLLGGKEGLQGLKDPICETMYGTLAEFLSDPANQNKIKEVLLGHGGQQKEKGSSGNSQLQSLQDSIGSKIETMIDNRLNELTPKKVKHIVSDIIRSHLGWLVIWGGVAGFAIGLFSAAFQGL